MAPYDDFTAIRKKFRPNIVTHRKKRKKSGWNHLLCGICEGLKRKLRHHKRGSSEWKQANVDLDDHYDNEEAARREYYKVRRKVTTTHGTCCHCLCLYYRCH